MTNFLEHSFSSFWNLHPVQEAGISIYREITAIFERHGLRHFAGYGTALGAVRHGGFIPWDDDIDLLMPRPDYEAFFSIAKKELPQHLEAMKEPVVDGYRLSFGKVRETDENTIRSLEEASNLHLAHGISIDIFPLDGCPANRLKFYLWQSRISLINAMLWARAEENASCNLPWRLKLRLFLGRFLNAFFFSKTSSDELVKLKHKLESSYAYDSSEMAGVIGSIYGIRTMRIPKAYYGCAIKKPFGNVLISLPENADGYLKSVYGDYMTLPPQSEQIPKHLMKIEHE